MLGGSIPALSSVASVGSIWEGERERERERERESEVHVHVHVGNMRKRTTQSYLFIAIIHVS